MKIFSIGRSLAMLALVIAIPSTRVAAQGFALSVVTSTNSVATSNSVTYAINVTNQTAFILPSVFVTNTFSTPIQILNATNSQGTIFTNANSVLFSLGQLFSGGIAQLAVTIAPTAAGSLTNTVIVAAPGTVVTNASTNVVIQVTNTAVSADLGVSIVGPVSSVFVNDTMILHETVTNAGPNDASNFVLSNNFSAGVLIVSVSPTNQTTLTNHSLIFNLGTLTNGTARTFTLTVQPTNAGVLTFSANASAAGIADTNSANNSASTNITVNALIAGQLVAVTNSAQTFNPQTGLIEQTILLSNVGTNAVASARVILTGLTNRLYNAVGTNGGNPYVVYANTLNTNQSVNLLLEFFVPTRLPFPLANSQLQAFGVAAVSVTSPTGTNGSFMITRTVLLPSGNVLVEFLSIPGKTYTVLYSDSMSSTNILVAQPPIVAPADHVQWIDDGPPKTTSTPASVPSRFYRVLLNP